MSVFETFYPSILKIKLTIHNHTNKTPHINQNLILKIPQPAYSTASASFLNVFTAKGIEPC